MKNKRQIFITTLSVLVSVFLVAGVAMATTTVGLGITNDSATTTGIALTGTYTTAGIQIGNSTTAITLTAAGDYAIDSHTTSSFTSGTAVGVSSTHHLTANGAYGRAGLFTLEVDNVQIGQWSNALKAHIDFNTTGSGAGGLGSAINAEMTLPAGARGGGANGAYAVHEVNLNAPTGLTGTTPMSFFWVSANGNEVSQINDYGLFFNVRGLTGAADDLLSLTSQTLKSRVGSSTRYLVLSQMQDGLGLGNSSTDMALGTTVTNRAIQVYTSSASTDTGTSVRPIYMQHTVLGTGGVGHRAEFHTRADVVVGTWINALKGYMEFDASLTAGRTTGLASAVCAEMKLPNSAVSTGHYYPLEIELVGQSNAFKGVASGFMTLRATGNIDGIDSDGYFMHVTGLSAGATAMLSANSQTLKTLIGNSTTRYLMLSQAQDSLSLDGMATGISIGDAATAGIAYTGTIGTGIDMSAGTVTTDIKLSNSATIHNTSADVLTITEATTAFAGKMTQAVTLTGSSAANAFTTTITDDTTFTSASYSKGINIAYTQAGAKTGSGAVNALAVDYTTAANTTYSYAAALYTAISGSPTVGQLIGLEYYGDALGSATVTDWYSIALGMDSTGNVATNSSYIYAKTHGSGIIDSVIRLNGQSGTGAATYFLDFVRAESPVSVDAGTPGANSTHKIAVQIAGSTYYIPVYADY